MSTKNSVLEYREAVKRRREEEKGKREEEKKSLPLKKKTKPPRMALNKRLWEYSGVTARVWLLLLKLLDDYEEPFIFSMSEISDISNVSKRISPQSVSRALYQLEELGMVEVRRRGNVSVIRLVKEQED